MQSRALVTYLRRIYFPFTLREPELRAAGAFSAALWAFEDPVLAGRPAATERLGCALLLPALSDLPPALEALQAAVAESGGLRTGAELLPQFMYLNPLQWSRVS